MKQIGFVKITKVSKYH